MTDADPRAARRTLFLALTSAFAQALVLFGVGFVLVEMDPLGLLLPRYQSRGEYDTNMLFLNLGTLGVDFAIAGIVGALAAGAAGRFLARSPVRLSTGQVLLYAWLLPYVLLIALANLLLPETEWMPVAAFGAGFIFGPPLAAGGAVAGFLSVPPSQSQKP